MKQDIRLQYEFRNISKGEVEEAIAIEQSCFPPHEACSVKNMMDRIEAAPQYFFVAIEKKSGKIAGFLNGIATKETVFRDEFFIDTSLHEPEGQTLMLLGLDILQEYRGQGLATAIMEEYICRMKSEGKKLLVLTCLESKIKMYEKMGYEDLGFSSSTWGGERWYEMSYKL